MVIQKKDLIYLSIIAVLVAILCFTYFGGDATVKKNEEKYNRSEGIEEQLRKELAASEESYTTILNQRDSLIDASFVEQDTRGNNKTKYYEKKFSNYLLPLDSSIIYSAEWLSEADTLGW